MIEDKMRKSIQDIIIKNFNLSEIIDIKEDKIGHTDAEVYFINTKEEKLVLKIHKNAKDKYLFNLSKKLKWLECRLPVSKVKAYKIIDKKEYLLTNFIDGEPSFQYGHKNNQKSIGIILGESLRKIHDLEINSYPFKINHEKKIERLLEKIKKDLIKKQTLEYYFTSLDKNEILVYIKSLIPSKWDLVFSHGDYCLPNILIKDDKLSGFIDLGDCGIADRNFDLYYGLWSLKYNNLDQYSDDFLNSYGKDKVSEKKLDLFKLLDEVLCG